MVLTTAYMTSMKNISSILESLKDAGVPPRFTHEFLKGLGFTSSNDRAILNVLKGLGFLDQQGVPTELYKQYRDKTKSKRVLAEALREAYGDLFLAHEKANQLSPEKIRGFFASKTGKGERVVEQMAATFRTLAQYADFSGAPAPVTVEAVPPEGLEQAAEKIEAQERPRRAVDAEFHYNIQIHLPATRDIAVYNAIFKAVRENLG
ncbi:MAG: DUF5343 domain-containing protein [Chloroflexi bacterium]|nr:DUF5343 domain-containing protein [Chloroflexota bacterium]